MMKKTIAFTMTGIAVLLFANSQAFAASELGFGDDMGEGISFGEATKSAISYKYDNSIPDAGDMMVEGVVLSKPTQSDIHYVGDNSIDSIQHLMTDGICMETLNKSVLHVKLHALKTSVFFLEKAGSFFDPAFFYLLLVIPMLLG